MDPVELNIRGVSQLVTSRLNKVDNGAVNQEEGETGERVDEFTLDLSDEELLKLAKDIETGYAKDEIEIKTRQEANKTFYLGKWKSDYAKVTGDVITSNNLFEAVETFLPAAFSRNPEPVTWSDDTKDGEQYANDIKTMLQYHVDVLSIRRKMQLTVRKWMIDMLGVVKFGWDDKIQEISVEVRDAKNFVFDPNGYVDVDGDFVGMLGERVKLSASKLIDMFPKFKDYIVAVVDGHLGTEVTYTQWWNDDFCFYTFKEVVLDKHKNPNFNLPQTKEKYNPVSGQIETVELKGNNHFAIPKKPFLFFGVFSFGEKAHDTTGLIEQNIPNQKRITRRTEQIDYNISKANNSDVFSESNFNQETAKQASQALAKGNPVLIPKGGPIKDAIDRLPAPSIPPVAFNDLQISKTDLKTIFGTEGLSSQPMEKNELATNLIMNERHDTSRIGGGIGDVIESFAKGIFNWMVQLYYVYYDEPHVASIMGQMRAVEHTRIHNAMMSRKVVVSVAPNSMKPRDEVSEMNQAIQLYQQGLLDPKTALTRLNFPDPQETAGQAVLWLVDKQAYIKLNFPDLQQKLEQLQQGQPPQTPPEVQVEQQKAQIEMQKAQAEMQMKAQEHNEDLQFKQAEHQMKLRQEAEKLRAEISKDLITNHLKAQHEQTKLHQKSAQNAHGGEQGKESSKKQSIKK